jgi:DNA-binding HxlR family transcriptional regulator
MFDVSAFEQLDKVIHERGRMAIMSLLAVADGVAFKELREQLRMTDGNLSVHMRTLEEAGYVAVAKSFVNRKPRTEYSLTPAGRSAFQGYIQTLEEIVKQSQRAEEGRADSTRTVLLAPGIAPIPSPT